MLTESARCSDKGLSANATLAGRATNVTKISTNASLLQITAVTRSVVITPANTDANATPVSHCNPMGIPAAKLILVN